jgi:inosine-uridine nucleoside N-ribohydrolase
MINEEVKKSTLVIDTDIGTDCDDAFALAYAFQAMKEGKLNIHAITTVHGNTNTRAKIARKLERVFNLEIPLVPGESCSEEAIKKYWTGIEERILSEEEKQENLESSAWPSYNENTKLVCIGPLTNIAKQLETNPSIKKVKVIYVMGSSMSSHNFHVDLEATKKVFEQPWDIYQVTKEDSAKVAFSREELELFRGNKLGELLYSSSAQWFDYATRDKAIMYDVLAVSAAFNEGFVKFYSWNNRHLSYDVSADLKKNIVEVIKHAG